MCDLSGENFTFMWGNFEAKSNDLMKEGIHFVEEVCYCFRKGVTLAGLERIIRINREVATGKLLLKCCR